MSMDKSWDWLHLLLCICRYFILTAVWCSTIHKSSISRHINPKGWERLQSRECHPKAYRHKWFSSNQSKYLAFVFLCTCSRVCRCVCRGLGIGRVFNCSPHYTCVWCRWGWVHVQRPEDNHPETVHLCTCTELASWSANRKLLLLHCKRTGILFLYEHHT